MIKIIQLGCSISLFLDLFPVVSGRWADVRDVIGPPLQEADNTTYQNFGCSVLVLKLPLMLPAGPTGSIRPLVLFLKDFKRGEVSEELLSSLLSLHVWLNPEVSDDARPLPPVDDKECEPVQGVHCRALQEAHKARPQHSPHRLHQPATLANGKLLAHRGLQSISLPR